MRNHIFSTSMLLVSVLAIIGAANISASAQKASGPPKPTTTPGPVGPTKVPDTPHIIVPKLHLKGAEPFHVGGSVPKDLIKVVFTFSNWEQFPTQWFKPAPDSPNLPPDPCRQIYTQTRMFLILHSEDGKVKRCASLNAKEDFYFLFEKDKPIPEFVYVVVTDRTNGMKFKSTLVSPSGGQTK